MVKIFSDSRYRIDKTVIKQQTDFYLKKEGFTHEDNLNIIFVGARKMKQLVSTYKREKTVLPVLTFSYLNDNTSLDQEKLIGEIFICYPQTVFLAVERERKVNDIIIQLIEHGIGTIQ